MTSTKRTIGESTGLGGANLIVSKDQREIDAESMILPPEEKISKEVVNPAVAITLTRTDSSEFNIVGLLKGVEARSGSLTILIQALLPVALQGCSFCLGNERMPLVKMEYLAMEEPIAWEFENWELQAISAREIAGKSSFVVLTFGKKA